MTYLELCRKVARESGTVSGDDQPTTVTAQTGRLRRIVDWTQDAWAAIQRSRSSWRWMEAEFNAPGTIINGLARYTAANFAFARFAQWLYDAEDTFSGFVIYDPAIGAADEQPINFVEWHEFRRRYLWGSHENDRPQVFSISPAQELVLYPTPDKTYGVRGRYKKSVQVLAADGDTPEMPSDHHDLIWRGALLYLAAYDENQTQPPLWRIFQMEGMDALVRDQLPKIGNAYGAWN